MSKFSAEQMYPVRRTNPKITGPTTIVADRVTLTEVSTPKHGSPTDLLVESLSWILMSWSLPHCQEVWKERFGLGDDFVLKYQNLFSGENISTCLQKL